MLKIKDLTAINIDTPLIKNISLEINAGEIHAIVGPKNSGKSALAHTITGHPGIDIESGQIMFGRRKLNSLNAEEISKLKIFVSFQNPPIFQDFRLQDLNYEFFDLGQEEIKDLCLKYIEELDFLSADMNELIEPIGQVKRNEIIHMLLSDPKLVIVDEIEVGLSDEEMVATAGIIKRFLTDNKKAGLIISRNNQFLDIIQPTHVHLMVNGTIRMSGGPDLYKRIVDDEYSEFS